MNGIGVGVDFYSDAFVWDFINAFLLIRIVCLLLSLIFVIAVFRDRKGIGDVAVLFLNFAWISTVILGSKCLVCYSL